MSDPKSILKRYWGYDKFRPLQEDIIQSVLDSHPTLALLPTGGGKSICFQVPALCMEGICLVVSPLIALMKDQVEQLNRRGVKAVAVYSGMSPKEIDVLLDNCVYGDVKFLYVSPERLRTDLFLGRAQRMTISMVAVDEAHCISQWGYDFRPSYLLISEFLEKFNISKVIALTASATKEVKEDILEKLNLKEAKTFQKSFARSNLSYSVFELERKDQKMVEILRNVPGSSIVYVRSRKQTQEISAFLNKQGIEADYYHAGLTGEVRSSKQEKWIRNQLRVMVATNAFGMGIDKPDVRTVIHFDLPDAIEAYYQEAGRAGRDEKKAFAIQLFHQQDLINLETRAEKSTVSVEFIKRVYQALANYYKLAVGSNAYSSFDFEYQTFVKNFDLPGVETFYALNKLMEEGIIQLNDSFKEPSRLMFLMPQSEVYGYQVANKNMDPVIKAVMRLYGGELFTSYVKVKEKDVAALLKESVTVAKRQLEYLSQAEVVDYQHSSELPKITFLTPRFEVNNLPLDKKRIEWRKKVTMEKVAAIKDYALNNQKCRTRFIQNYFNELATTDCGVCDICLRRTRKAEEIPLRALMDYIHENPRKEEALKDHFKELDPDQLIMGLRILMDRGEIALNEKEEFTKRT